MDSANERSRAVGGFLRQLWFGLATYRLYPDDPARSGFLTSAGLIQAAARSVLEAGSPDIEISAKGFSAPGIDLPTEAPLIRLARVCFERRAESLRVTGVPSAPELNTLFTALTMPIDELDRMGGLEARLADVTSIALVRLGPTRYPGGRGPIPVEGMDPRVDVPISVTAAASLIEGLSGSVDDQADDVLRRLHTTLSTGTGQAAPDTDVYADLCGALVVLPEGLRRSVIGKLVEQGTGDPLAERLIGSLSNAELSRAIVNLGGTGGESLAMAQQLADSGIRMPDIVDFTAALQAGFEDGSTILAGLEQIGSPPIGSEAGMTVADSLAEHLLASEPADTRALLELSTAGELQGSALGLATLQDYLELENEPIQFELVGEVWAQTTREALLRGEHLRVLELVSTVERSHHPRDRRSFLDVYAPLAVDRYVVAEIVHRDTPEDGPTPFLLLSPFGETAVDVLFAELAEEPDRGRRAALLGVLRQLAPGRSEPVVRRLDDTRWYVVRNAVNVLRYSRHPRSLDLMAEAAKHAAEAVRREAVFGLAAGGTAAVPYLGALAAGPDASVRILAIEALRGLAAPESATALVVVVSRRGDLKTRRSALDALAEHPSPEASSALVTFSVRGQARPRLPRSLRKRAQSLVRARDGGVR
jgi:hypothetical protein